MEQQTKEQKRCVCGRDSTIVHCPRCGSTAHYGLVKQSYFVDNIQVFSYRCRRCGLPYSDVDRVGCGAPIFRIPGSPPPPPNDGLTVEQRMEKVRARLRGGSK